MQYISLKEATQYCHHSQDYLKLRARQGKLKAAKIGRNWATTREWVEEYSGRNIQEIQKSSGIRFWKSNTMITVFLVVVGFLIITGIFINLDVFNQYFQWQIANVSSIFNEGLKMIPGKTIDLK
ncbi:MAG: hypothetical protein Q8P63_02245 [Candidatus Nealsonbacteria bacterium]|nr:hypothetical protein [Candidatus Nealsonbacteria bacterium]